MDIDRKETIYFILALAVFSILILLAGVGTFGEKVQDWIQNAFWFL